jgi:anti-sigma regulatory factor (Ser/Thr protein kinase)
MRTDAAILGSLTIPGRAEHVSEARAFVAKFLGEDHPSAEVAVLLASEVVTNAVLHSDSRCTGGTVRVVVVDSANGILVKVADDGSRRSAPVVKADIHSAEGRGLFLVQQLAAAWGYLQDEAGRTVWFRLDAALLASADR